MLNAWGSYLLAFSCFAKKCLVEKDVFLGFGSCLPYGMLKTTVRQATSKRYQKDVFLEKDVFFKKDVFSKKTSFLKQTSFCPKSTKKTSF